MTLINGLLAFGALAFTVPLAIHLWYRSRFRTVSWGAMHLLETVVRTNRRQIELMNWILLLLRCLLPVILAFCLARPVLTGFNSLPGDVPQSLVIAIDDSLSLSVRDPDGTPRIDRIKRELGSLIGNLSRQDEVTLVTTGDGDRPAETLGPTMALSKLQTIDAAGGPANLGALVRAAVAAANQSRHQDRRVIVVSDFQSGMVDEAAIESLSGMETTLAGQAISPSIQFWNLGVGSSELSNVSVDSVASDSAAIVAGRASRFSAVIRNAGDLPARELRLNWTVAGKTLPPQTITVPPRSTVTARLQHTIDDPGVHPLSVAVEISDALPADNVRTIGVDVIRQVDVLLVDGDPSERPLAGETDFLAIALSPFAFGGQDLPDAVRTSKVGVAKLRSTLTKQSPDLIMLANVHRIDAATKSAVGQYVFGGGSLVIFDGDRIDPSSYNTTWGDGPGTFYLPMIVGDLVGRNSVANKSVDDNASVVPATFSIGDIDRQYTPWNFLVNDGSGANDGNGLLSGVDVFGYRRLQPRDATTRTCMSLANGDPLVAMADVGRGSVVQFAIPADLAKTNLPTQLVFLPLIQQLTLDLAGSKARTTVDVGTPIQIPLRELVPLDASGADKKIATMMTPNITTATFAVVRPGGTETVVDVAANDASNIEVTDTREAGIYRVRRRLQSPGGADPIVTQTIRVASIPASESLLRDAESSRLARAAELVGGTVGDELATLSAQDQTRRFGREVWRWLLVALLMAMIGEMWLQQRGVGRSVVTNPRLETA